MLSIYEMFEITVAVFLKMSWLWILILLFAIFLLIVKNANIKDQRHRTIEENRREYYGENYITVTGRNTHRNYV